MQANEKIFEQDEEEIMTATDAILKTVQELANKCESIEEFREALAKIIAKQQQKSRPPADNEKDGTGTEGASLPPSRP